MVQLVSPRKLVSYLASKAQSGEIFLCIIATLAMSQN
jgi:hypothetical protein